jgi:hypothetical protein
MKGTSPLVSHRGAAAAGASARRLAGLALVVLALGGVLFAGAWAIGGEDAVSDNWVGMTVAVALFTGLIGTLVAFLMALYEGWRSRTWPGLWLPLTAFPAVVLVVALLEAFVFE